MKKKIINFDNIKELKDAKLLLAYKRLIKEYVDEGDFDTFKRVRKIERKICTMLEWLPVIPTKEASNLRKSSEYKKQYKKILDQLFSIYINNALNLGHLIKKENGQLRIKKSELKRK